MLQSKFKLLLFCAIFGILIPWQSFSQTTKKRFFSRHFHLDLSSSGTYTLGPWFGNMPTLGYKAQDTISFGHYIKEGRYYVLNADKSITDNQGECTDFSVYYSKSLQSDSLIIFIRSPYEDLLKVSDYARIYTYLLTLYCSDGNVISISDTTNRIPIYLNDEQHVSKIDVYISYRPDFYSTSDAYSFTHSPYSHILLENVPEDSNYITIYMPNFKYFSLTYLPYRNYKVQIINKHTLLANGEIFHRFDLKYKMKLRRMNRKLQRHPIL